MKSLKLSFMFVLILCFTQTPFFTGHAQDLSRKGPCQADIKKFCRSVKPGNGRILKCMRQYDRHLSDPCQNHIGQVREKTAGFVKACKADAQKFCSHVRPGRGEVYRCLRPHHAKLSALCANQVK